VIREDHVKRCEGNKTKKTEVRRLTSFVRFISERENLVLDSLIYLEPVERFLKLE